MNEFDIIQKYFRSLTHHRSVKVSIGDDCAVLAPPADQQIAMSMDTLVSGVHFDHTFTPEDIGYKALAVNLSDLAAMGATPAWVMLSLTLPAIDEKFLAGFSKGFFSHFQQHPMTLIGGDLTQGPLSITIQISGFTTHPILRSGAQVGDAIYVTHTVGDAALALHYLQKKISLSEIDAKKILPRLYRPTARIVEGVALRDIATSAIDVSDGLYGDLNHILTASRVGAEINVDQLPVSDVVKKLPTKTRRSIALYGGDAYELCFTAPAQLTLPPLACGATRIGTITEKTGIILQDAIKQVIAVVGESFTHFV